MSEQQLEIETGCQKCGQEIGEYRYTVDHVHTHLCYSCSKRQDEIRDQFYFADDVISKVIYNSVSKTDLKIFHSVMYLSAKNDIFSEFEINQTALAKKLFMQQANISRSLKNLVKAELLTKNTDTNLYSFTMSKY